ncbi:MAG TPA: GNAT family N-acetyltransferase [Chloroflexia bacterium]|nr:GNAT family N-acetyltransferase [Chloroflexia bacterium]
MQIRLATPADSEGIARVQVDSYRSAYQGILPDAYLALFIDAEEAEDWRELLSGPTTRILYVAEDADRHIVGYALGAPESGGLPAYASELIALHVLPAQHRQGIGRALFAAVAQALAQAGCSSLMLWVLAANPARGFYEHLGGQLVGEQQVEIGKGDVGVTATEVAYGWPAIATIYE